MNLYTCMQTNSKCYKQTRRGCTPVGILWHSTGANNPYIKRYVQPMETDKNYDADIAKLGKNTYRNDWNHLQTSAGVNAFIGKFADGTIGTCQALPWDFGPWGSGSGRNGTLNYSYVSNKYVSWIQFEICEDGLVDKKYAQQVYDEAVELTAYLCKKFNIDPNGTFTKNGIKIPTITCHNDASKLGLATSHSDINHWFPKILGKDMNDVRREVAKKLGGKVDPVTPQPQPAAFTTLKKGSKGEAVKTLQTNLNKILGTSLVADGDFGNATLKAVKQFQTKYGLTADGIYGKNTDAKMQEVLKLATKEFKVRINFKNGVNIRKGPSLKKEKVGVAKYNEVYTIVEKKKGKDYYWGKLKSGKGWICLKYTDQV